MNSVYAIDLHVHSREGSKCSSISVSEILSRIHALPLNLVSITDHGSTSAYKIPWKREGSTGVLPGIEVSTTEGHFGIYSRDVDKLEKMPPYFQSVEDLPVDEDLFIVWLHPRSPCRSGWGPPAPEMMEKVRKYVQGVEVLNGKMLDLMLQKVVDPEYVEALLYIADRFNLVKTAGSDAHALHHLGVCWTAVKARSMACEDILSALKSGETSLHVNPEMFQKLGSLIT